MTLRPSPIFKPWLMELINGEAKSMTRRLKPCGKSGDFWYFREGIEKGPTGLAHFRNDKAHVRTAEGGCVRWRWKRDSLPSIHMPRELARSFALVLEHRQERLQAITQDDARAEGCDGSGNSMRSPLADFFDLWVRIHGIESWDANPMVHVYRFRLATRAEALAQ